MTALAGERSQARINEEAVEWVVRLNFDELDDKQRSKAQEHFDQWLRADDRHHHAWIKAEKLRENLADMKGQPQVNRLVNTAKTESATWFGWVQSLLRPAVAIPLFAVLVVAIWLPGLVESPQATENYSTAVAEVKDIVLDDGSQVTLGARSAIQVTLGAGHRRVVFSHGDALFDVSKDPTRSFSVAMGDVEVRVVGTAFDLHRGPREIRIGVREGAVDIVLAEQTRRLKSGELLRIVGDQPAEVTPFDANISGWRDGWLAYNNVSLAEVIADANRYSKSTISLSSPELGDFTVTTSYSVDQLDDMLRSLEQALPLEVIKTPVGILLKSTQQ